MQKNDSIGKLSREKQNVLSQLRISLKWVSVKSNTLFLSPLQSGHLFPENGMVFTLATRSVETLSVSVLRACVTSSPALCLCVVTKSTDSWVRMAGLKSCVALGRLLNVSRPQFSHLKKKRIIITSSGFNEILAQGLPWWPHGWKSACQCRGRWLDPRSRKIPHAAGQLSPRCHNYWSPGPRAHAPLQENPLQWEAHALQQRVAPVRGS